MADSGSKRTRHLLEKKKQLAYESQRDARWRLANPNPYERGNYIDKQFANNE